MESNPHDGRSRRPRQRSPTARVGPPVALAIALVALLVPATLGQPPGAPTALRPAYRHALSVPSTNDYTNGCNAVAKLGTPSYTGRSGTIRLLSHAAVKTCAPGPLGVAASNFALASPGMELAIPLPLGTSGNHTIASSWTVNLSALAAYTTSVCPRKNLTAHTAHGLYETAGCAVDAVLILSVWSELFDADNLSRVVSVAGEAYTSSERLWQNVTYCPAGTGSCTTSAGPGGHNYTSLSDATMSPFRWNGSNSVTIWTNASGMVASQHYVLEAEILATTEAYSAQYNLYSVYHGTATAKIDLSTSGEGAVLRSIMIL